MQKIKLLIVAAMALTLVSTGCGEKEENTEPAGSVAENKVTQEVKEEQTSDETVPVTESALKKTEIPETEAADEDENIIRINVPENFEDFISSPIINMNYDFPDDVYLMNKDHCGNYGPIMDAINARSIPLDEVYKSAADGDKVYEAIVDSEYVNSLSDYTEQIRLLNDSLEQTAEPTVLITGEAEKNMKFSPIINAFMNSHISCNPVNLFSNLDLYAKNAYGYRSVFGKDNPDFDEYDSGDYEVKGNTVVSGDKTEYLRNKISEYFGTDVIISYSESEDLYYTYIVSAENNLNLVAVYFKFENDRIVEVSADEIVYTNGELAALMPAYTFYYALEININPAASVVMDDVWKSRKDTETRKKFFSVYKFNVNSVAEMAKEIISSDNSQDSDNKVHSEFKNRFIVEKNTNGGEGTPNGIQSSVKVSLN